jgi:nicotinamide phosphoribosyltransferase
MSTILNTDSYKSSHFLQYPPNTQAIYSYIESRGVSKEFPELANAEIVHFGLQMFLKEYLSKPITQEEIDEAESILIPHGVAFNRKGWEYIFKNHSGYLPLLVEALPEGTIIKPHVPQVQVFNTDTECAWLTSYIEQALLRAVWYPSTVATISREMKKVLAAGLMKTQGNLDGLEFMLQDFGGRGVSSKESAGIGGVAHLVNFRGTDTLEGIMYARKYYSATEMPGFSVNAAEHSTITTWGREGEVDAYRNMIKQFGKPGQIVSIVADSYDVYNALENIFGNELKQEIIDCGGKVVQRPDSGIPKVVVVRCLDINGESFGFIINKMNYKELPKFLAILQGDGINTKSLPELVDVIIAAGWSINNMVFGMGGALLQKCDRDTFKYAMKCSAAMINNTIIDVYKDPITDPGKVSKKGVQAVILENGKYKACRNTELWPNDNQLITVYKNGQLFNETTFDEVRERAKL